MDGWLPWRVTHATRDARDGRDAMHIHVLYIYPSSSSSSHRRSPSVVVPISECIHRARHPRVHPCIHPSIHPPIHRATRRDATLPATSRRCTKKITRAKILRRIYDANTTYLDLRRLEGGDAGDEGGREEGRHRVCVCVRECRARRDRGGGGGRRHDDSDIRRRNDDSDIRRMHGDAPAGRLPRPWSWSSSVDGTPRARGRDWSHF